jgi:GGDEF domain-containing protein
MKEVNERLPGNKLFFFLDFNHMSVANRFGLKENVDQFISTLKGVAEKSFGDVPFEVLRMGGDEYAGFVQDTPQGREAIRRFIDGVEAKKREMFNDSKDSVVREKTEKGERFAAIRTVMRKLRSDYRKICDESLFSFTLEGYKEWLIQKGAVMKPEYAGLPIHRLVGILQRGLALSSVKEGAREGIMTVSTAVIPVGEQPTPTLIGMAKGKADKYIHKQKEKGQKITLEPQQITEDIRDQADDIYEREKWSEKEKKYQNLKRELLQEGLSDVERADKEMDLKNLQVQDPGVAEVLRLNLAEQVQIQEVFKVKEPTDFTHITLDIVGFGAINNNLGYAKGDAVYREVVTKVQEALKMEGGKNPKDSYFLVRSSGGDIHIFFKGTVDPSTIAHMRETINEYLKTQQDDARVLAEASEKEALAEMEDVLTGKPFQNDISFGTIDIKPPEKIRIDPSQKMITLFPK